VDLWDLTKLLFRRWYAFVPMLLVSIAIVVWVSQTVQPDYSATGHLQLIPPTSNPDDTTGPKRPFNPWMGLGLPALGNAVILKVQDEKVRHQLVEAGFTDNVTITIEYGTTYVTIEAIGTTPEQATGTVQRVMKVLDAEVTAQQRQFGVATQDSITTLPLDGGEKVTIVTSKKKRVLIVAAGVALLFSVGMTIALDAILRRRTRRRLEAAQAAGEAELDDEMPGDAPEGPTGFADRLRRRRGRAPEPRPAPATASKGPAKGPARTRSTKVVSASGVAGSGAAGPGRATRLGADRDEPTAVVTPADAPANGSAAPARPPVMIEYRQAGASGAHAAPDDDADAATRPLDQTDADATIILPLPRADWTAPQDKSKSR
jgi:hypothetical protein